MIHANELRIGNWVIDADTGLYLVVDGNLIRDVERGREVKGIEMNYDLWTMVPVAKNDDIKYLHILQNRYFFNTGEELEIDI